MKTISAFLGKIISHCLFVLMALLVAVTFFQVLCRFVFMFPAVWTEEVARMSFVWLIFLGAAIGVKEGTHLVLDMLASAVGPRLRRTMQIAILALIIGLSGIILYAGGSYCWRSRGKTTVTMPVPANVIYAVIPLSATLMIFFGVEKLREKLAERGDA